MNASRVTRLGVLVLVASSAAISGAGCLQDFDKFESNSVAPPTAQVDASDGAPPSSNDAAVADSANDVRSDATTDGGDGAVDCTALAQSCPAQRMSCRAACDTTRETCEAACPAGNPGNGCRTTCRTDQLTCQFNCNSACATCASGCPVKCN